MTVLLIVGAPVYVAGWMYFSGALAEAFDAATRPAGKEPTWSEIPATEKAAAMVCALTWPLLLPVVLLALGIENRWLARQERLRR